MRRVFTAIFACGIACTREEPPGVTAPPVLVVSSVPTTSAPIASASAMPPSADEIPEVDAPRLVALAAPTWIYEAPDNMRPRIGYARPGGQLRHAAIPIAKSPRCKEGWFRVAPRGYVCAGTETTMDLEHPIAKALAKGPKRGAPLPYRYGRSRPNPPYFYARVTTSREQRQIEGEDFDEHLEKSARPPVTLLGEPSSLPSFLSDGKVLPNPLNEQKALRLSGNRGMANARSSFAFVDVFDIEHRLFGLSTEADLIPIDRVRLAALTPIHGGPVDDLPVAIVWRAGVSRYRRDSGRLFPDGLFDVNSTLSLLPQPDGELWETTDHQVLMTKLVQIVPKRTSFPGFLDGEDAMKWVDISLREQTLVAYEGKRAVYVARVSTGAGGEGDPETTNATIQGYFRIQSKHVTVTMTGNRSDENEYALAEVPYVQYFQGSYALHAAFWHERFGHPHSHGCINLPPTDAAWLFEWTDPIVPPEWHGAEARGAGTMVYVHP